MDYIRQKSWFETCRSRKSSTIDCRKSCHPNSLGRCHQKGRMFTVIHATHKMFDDNKTEEIPLENAENALNTINRKILLHNTE